MRTRKAQSIIEYAVLVAAIAAAFVAMQMYVRRSVSGRLKAIESELNEPIVLNNSTQ